MTFFNVFSSFILHTDTFHTVYASGNFDYSNRFAVFALKSFFYE